MCNTKVFKYMVLMRIHPLLVAFSQFILILLILLLRVDTITY